MNKPRNSFGTAARSAGFSLVELMVGLVIGMIAVFVMMQVFQVSEGYKRTAGSGADAQTGGTILLDQLQRDIQQSGYGLSGPNSLRSLGCNVRLPSGRMLNGLGAVTINHADIPPGAANTDTLLVVRGGNGRLPAGDWVDGLTSGTNLKVANGDAFEQADLVMFVAGVTEPNPLVACPYADLRLQPVASRSGDFVNLGVEVASTDGEGLLLNLGSVAGVNKRVSIQAYAVRNNALTVCDLMVNDCSVANAAAVNNTAVWTPIEGNVASMRALYGRDITPAPMDGTVDVYDQASPTTACTWLRVAAVRLTLVTQSPQFEKTAVTLLPPSWAGSAVAPVDLTGIADWQRYRYRMFQTVIPLRNNALTGGRTAATGGC